MPQQAPLFDSATALPSCDNDPRALLLLMLTLLLLPMLLLLLLMLLPPPSMTLRPHNSALESFARCALEWRWLPAACVPARLDLLLFSAGVGAITHAYSDQHGLHRDLFRSKYLNVLDFVLGSTGMSPVLHVCMFACCAIERWPLQPVVGGSLYRALLFASALCRL
jgi:hypothetical protein